MENKTTSPYANWWLSGLFFVEAFFFIPVDPVLMVYCIKDRNRSFFFAAIATISSVLGGIFGYLIGALFWETIGSWLVSWIVSAATFKAACDLYGKYENAAVLIAGFTPVPYKAITLSAGFCRLPIIPFVAYSLISRGARFFLIAGLLKIWGKQVKSFIDRYFNLLVLLFAVLIVASFLLLGCLK